MPIVRYFVYVGCVLAALLFAADWIWSTEPKAPSPQAASVGSPVEQTIRIQSARRWPDRIVFDTNQPIIAPPPVSAVAASAPPPAPVAAANSVLDARAELKPVAPPVSTPKRQAKARHPNARQDAWHDPWRHDPWRQPNTFASAGPATPSWPFGRW